MAIDVLKSYLIDLGFGVDKKSFDGAKKAISDTEKTLSDMASKSAKSFIAAGAAVSTFLVAANAGITKFVSNLASADLKYDMMARQLWTSKENAESFDKTLKAMGVTLEQLYLSPELAGRFRELRSSIKDMRPPAEFKDQMKLIRDIQYEFTRFKLSVQYAMQWVGHYLIKYLAGPLNDAKKQLQGFNDRFIKAMPIWAERVGRLGASFVNAGRHMIQFFNDIRERIGKLLDSIPTNVKGVASALGGIALLLRTGPFGILVGMLTMAILLIDDFYTHMQGGKSALGPMWDKLLEWKDKLAETGQLDKLKGAFDGLMESLNNVLTALGDLAMALTGTDNIYDAMAEFGNLGLTFLIKALERVSEVLDGIRFTVEAITSLTKGDFGNFVINKGEEAKQGLINEGKAEEGESAWENIKGWGKAAVNPFKAREGWDRVGIMFSDALKLFKGKDKEAEPSADTKVKDPLSQFRSYGILQDKGTSAPTAFADTQGLEQMKQLGSDTKSGNKSLSKIADDSRYLSTISTGIKNVTVLLAKDALEKGYFGYTYQNPVYPAPQAAPKTEMAVYQTNNVYGSDPQATSDAVTDKMAALMRNTRGWGV